MLPPFGHIDHVTELEDVDTSTAVVDATEGLLRRPGTTLDAPDAFGVGGVAAAGHGHDDTYAPLTHADRHAQGAADEVTPASIGAAAEGHGHDPTDNIGLITLDAGTVSYVTTAVGDVEVTVETVWGIDGSGDPYYDDANATSGEEAALRVDPDTGQLYVAALNLEA